MRPVRYLFLLLIPLVPICQDRLESAVAPAPGREGRLYLRTGEEVRRLVPGLEGLMADLYWLRTVQYYGRQRLFSTEKRYELLRPLIDITTALDPRFELAYRYGAIFLGEDWPSGPGKPEEGAELLEQGARALPHSWRIRWDLGSLHFFFLKDAKKAAAALLDGAKLPGAPFWLESLAAKLLLGDDRAASREIWQRHYESSASYMRDNALYHLRVLDMLDTRDHLQGLVNRFQEKQGRLPRDLSELVAAGYAREIPRDPSGTPFRYDAGTGKVRVARESRYWRSQYE